MWTAAGCEEGARADGGATPTAVCASPTPSQMSTKSELDDVRMHATRNSILADKVGRLQEERPMGTHAHLQALADWRTWLSRPFDQYGQPYAHFDYFDRTRGADLEWADGAPAYYPLYSLYTKRTSHGSTGSDGCSDPTKGDSGCSDGSGSGSPVLDKTRALPSPIGEHLKRRASVTSIARMPTEAYTGMCTMQPQPPAFDDGRSHQQKQPQQQQQYGNRGGLAVYAAGAEASYEYSEFYAEYPANDEYNKAFDQFYGIDQHSGNGRDPQEAPVDVFSTGEDRSFQGGNWMNGAGYGKGGQFDDSQRLHRDSRNGSTGSFTKGGFGGRGGGGMGGGGAPRYGAYAGNKGAGGYGSNSGQSFSGAGGYVGGNGYRGGNGKFGGGGGFEMSSWSDPRQTPNSMGYQGASRNDFHAMESSGMNDAQKRNFASNLNNLAGLLGQGYN